MRRRQVLASSTALLLAGCVSQGDGTTPSTESDPAGDTETPTATPTETATVVLEEQHVQPGVVTMNSPDSIAVRGGDGQFLLVHVETTAGPAPSRSSFTFHVDGDTHHPESYDYQLFKNGNYDVEYDPDTGSGWHVFALPERVDADSATLSWPGGDVGLSEHVRTRLETPSPPFDVSFQAPATVSEEADPTLSITAENVGDVAGRCVLALNRVGPDIAYAPSREITVDLDAGESTTREFDAKSPYDATGEPNDVTYHLVLVGGDRISRTIAPSE